MVKIKDFIIGSKNLGWHVPPLQAHTMDVLHNFRLLHRSLLCRRTRLTNTNKV